MACGCFPPRAEAEAPRAATDMGNVSHRVPSIQPMIGYDTGGAAHHTAAFAEHGTSASADRAVLDGGLAMALVVLELAARRGISR